MEPLKAEITRWIVFAKVVDVTQRTKSVYVEGYGKDTIMRSESIGWWVRFEGSQEAMYFGNEEPDINVGDHFKVSFERIIKCRA